MYQDILEELISKVELTVDEGIEADIRGIFRDDETIKEYKLIVNQNRRYELYIALKNSSKSANEKKFFEFMRCIQHPVINIYSRTNSDYGKKYVYLSATKDMRGFCFEVYFEC